MNTVGGMMGNAGAPVVASLADGRTIHVRRLDQGGKTKIEQYLKGLAKSQLLEDRSEMTDAEYGMAYEAFLRLTASAEFKFGGAVFQKFITSGAGGMYLIRSLSRWPDGKELTDADVEALTPADLESLKLSASQALAESFPKGPAPAHAPGTSAPVGPLAL